jgi:hypothetical protein
MDAIAKKKIAQRAWTSHHQSIDGSHAHQGIKLFEKRFLSDSLV